MPIYVTKSFMPNKADYLNFVNEIFERGMLTNQGPLVQELESKMRSF